MAGEVIRTEAACLAIRPWSRTSHVVTWLTQTERVATLVKGAVRPKSMFLGQYDLNYTCDIVYYSRAKGDLHALRECAPISRRDNLRDDYRALALADYFRRTAYDLAPTGPECADWFRLLTDALDGLSEAPHETADTNDRLSRMLAFEMKALDLAGLSPDLSDAGNGFFHLRGERRIPVSSDAMRCLRNPRAEKNPKILLDAARVIGVFYVFHLDWASDVRRTVIRMICNNT